MKRNNNFGLSSFSSRSTVRRLCAVLCLALMLGAEGCRDDLEVSDPDTSRPKDSFSVSIALAGMGSEQTRAAGEDSEDTAGAFGTADENYIDIDDLYVMTFSIPDGETTLTGDSELLEVIWKGSEKGQGTDTRIYYNGTTAYLNTWLDSKIDEYKPDPGKDFCLVAIANFSQYKKTGLTVPLSKDTKFSDLQNALKYDFAQKPIAKKGIPLFGVKRVNLRGYNKRVNNVSNPYILESNGNPTLWMLRAFSKIEVALSDELLEMEQSTGSITIQSASVNKYGSTFWVIPELDRMSGFEGAEGTGGTGQVKSAPSDDFQSVVSNETKIDFTIKDEGKTAVIYLPEYGLNTASENKIVISVTLKFGVYTQEFEFDLKYYGNSEEIYKPYWKHLLRNYNYKFLIDVDFKVISVIPQQWDNTYDNEFIFG